MTVKKRRGFDVDDAPVSSSGSARPRPDDLVDVVEFSKNWRSYRPVGQVFAYGLHWVTTKKRDGSRGAFRVPCLAFDPETGERDSTQKCPWCDHRENHPGSKEKPGLVGYSTEYWFNVIDRKLQDNAPTKLPKPEADERSSGFKMKDSDSWTPVRAARLSGQDLKKLRNLKDLNRIKNKKTGETVAYSVFDVGHGADISILMNKDEKVPANRFQVQIGDKNALSDEEQAYLVWDLSNLEDPPTLAETNSEYKKWADRMGVGSSGDSDDEDDEDKPKRKSKAEKDAELKKSAKDRLRNALDDDDEDEDDAPPPKKGKKPAVDEDDEDEDDTPPVKKSTASKKKPIVDEDEDEDDDAPPPKKGKPAVKKKPIIDEDDEDEDEDDDEPPVKKGKPVAKSKKVVEEDDDEDDDEDTPPPKKGKAVTSKKKVVDEDDEDEDEDDTPPPKSKGKVASKGKKPVVEDDDDDF